MIYLRVILMAAVCVVPAMEAEARQWVVNSVNDRTDAIAGDGVCSTGIPLPGTPEMECTLRAAVQEANASARGVREIHVPAGTYRLTRRAMLSEEEERQQIRGTIGIGPAAATGDLDIRRGVAIIGAGAGLTVVSGNSTDRVFDIWSDFATTVRIQNLTIEQGLTTAPGGCVHVRAGLVTLLLFDAVIDGCVAHESVGGGLYSQGIVEMSRTVISRNIAARGAGAENGFLMRVFSSTIDSNDTQVGLFGSATGGGGIANLRRLTLTDSTISNNESVTNGGGLINYDTATLTNVTISGNRGSGITFRRPAEAGTPEDGQLALFNVTITNNGPFGIDRTTTAAVTLDETIVAGNTENCRGTVTRSSYSLDGGTSCGLIGTGDLTSTDPLLGPLANNGGTTLTHALLPGSPAIDAARFGNWRDQRGVPRPLGAAYDIGAVEAGADPSDVVLRLPISWDDLFRTPLPSGSTPYTVEFNLLTLAGYRDGGARLVGATAGQAPLKFTVANDGRSIAISSVTPGLSPNDNPNAPAPLFYLEVQQGLRLPALLYTDSVSCQCNAKRRGPAPMLIPRFRAK